MTRKTTESYGKHANRAQIERRIKSEEISRRVNCHRIIISVCRCFLPLLSQKLAGTISLLSFLPDARSPSVQYENV